MIDKALFALPGVRRALAVLVALDLVRAFAVAGQAWGLVSAVVGLWGGGALSDQAGWIALFALCMVARQVLLYAQDAYLEKYAAARADEMRQALLGAVFTGGASVVQAHGTGAVSALVLEGVDQVETYLRLILPKMVGVVVIPVVLLFWIFPQDWVSGLISLVAFPAIIMYMVILGHTAQDEAAKRHAKFEQMSNHFIDSLRGIDTLKLFGRSKAHGQEVYEVSEQFREATVQTLRIATLSSAALDLIATLALAGVSMMLGFRLLAGSMELFPALFALVAVPEYFKPVREFAADYHASLDGKNALAAIQRLVGEGGEQLAALRGADVGEPASRRAPSGEEEGAARHPEGNGAGDARHAERNGAGAVRHAERNGVGAARHPEGNGAGAVRHTERNGVGDARHAERSETSPKKVGDPLVGGSFASLRMTEDATVLGGATVLEDATGPGDVMAPEGAPSGAFSPIIAPWSMSSTLELRGVDYAFPDYQALSDVSFAVRGPMKVGIVGVSGAGKSTLVNLLAGFAAPSAGEVRVNGVPVDDLRRRDWQGQALYIPQNPYLFHATLRENIAFYTPSADEARIEAAVRTVGLEDLVDELPEGLDTMIGEGARALSGGQAQRIALARALLDDSRRVLLFDEPTAHLDIETELELKERMVPLMEGRLVFFATHRLHWMAQMDHILVMDAGRVVEAGTLDELRERDGAFCRLVARMGGGAR